MRWGAGGPNPFGFSGRPFCVRVLSNHRTRKHKWCDDEKGLAAIQRRCPAGVTPVMSSFYLRVHSAHLKPTAREFACLCAARDAGKMEFWRTLLWLPHFILFPIRRR